MFEYLGNFIVIIQYVSTFQTKIVGTKGSVVREVNLHIHVYLVR